MGPIQNLHEIISFLTRRWRLIGLGTVVGALAGLLVAMNTERVFEAAAVIQVTNPVISVNADGETAVPDVTRRVQSIEQRLMSREALLELGARYNLFDGMDITPVEQVAMMREAFSITSIAAAQQGFERDGSLSALIVAAQDDDPDVAAAIANELSESVIELSIADRQVNTQQALEFYRTEETRLNQAISELESEIARYRSENEQFLPDAVETRRNESELLTETLLGLQQQISARENELSSIQSGSTRAVTRRQITTLTEEIAQFNQQASLLENRMAELREFFRRAPEVEQQLGSMTRQMTQLQTQMTAAANSRRAAELGARIEGDQQAERFEILEPALVPEYPISRSRRKVAMMGVAGGIGLGIIVAYLLEWFFPVIRTATRMERDLQLRPVISIPLVVAEVEKRRRMMIWMIGGGVLFFSSVILAFMMGIF
ncbi:MAG: Wzz/FepE/Etk N-terminal domain-containing protein [Paracoccaceae bacterium]